MKPPTARGTTLLPLEGRTRGKPRQSPLRQSQPDPDPTAPPHLSLGDGTHFPRDEFPAENVVHQPTAPPRVKKRRGRTDLVVPEPPYLVKRKELVEIIDTPLPWKHEELREAQRTDARLAPMAYFLNTQEKDRRWSKMIRNWIDKSHEHYFMHNELLYHWKNMGTVNGTPNIEFQICIPHPFRLPLLETYHSTAWGCHQPFDTVVRKLQTRYYWPTMVADARNFVESCTACALYKKGEMLKVPLKPIRAVAPFYMIAMDVLTPNPNTPTQRGNRHILVVQDYFSKWVLAFPFPDQTAKTVLREVINGVFSVHGVPRIVLTDNGPCFTAKEFNDTLDQMGVDHRFAAPYHQQTNGMVERWNRTLLVMLRPLLGKHPNNWDDYLQMACFAYRTTPHSSTGKTPFQLVYGVEATFPQDALFHNATRVYSQNEEAYLAQLITTMKDLWSQASEKLRAAQESYKLQYDKKAKVRCFKPGALVIRVCREMLSTKHVPSKFHAYFDFLYRVVREDERGNLVVNKVLPPFTRETSIPKDQCKLFHGTIQDYSDVHEGIRGLPEEWTPQALLPQARTQQTTTSHDPNDDVDYEENSICPVCEIDYEHSSDQNWVYCDKCRQWHHFKCVGLDDAPETQHWYCPACLPPSPLPEEALPEAGPEPATAT